MEPLSLLVPAVVGAAGAGIAYRYYDAMIISADVKALQAHLDRWQADGALDDARSIVQAAAMDPWIVVQDPATRDKAGRTLASFCHAAREVPRRRPWKIKVKDSELEDLQGSLEAMWPLVNLIRTTPLELYGKARFYNGGIFGRKARAAEEIYKVLGIHPYRTYANAKQHAPQRHSSSRWAPGLDDRGQRTQLTGFGGSP